MPPPLLQIFLQRTDTLQSDLEVVLKASKDLISHLEPSAASLVQSECRLLPRGVLQLRQQLSRNLGHLQVKPNELKSLWDLVKSDWIYFHLKTAYTEPITYQVQTFVKG